jgi:hypothetical protein
VSLIKLEARVHRLYCSVVTGFSRCQIPTRDMQIFTFSFRPVCVSSILPSSLLASAAAAAFRQSNCSRISLHAWLTFYCDTKKGRLTTDSTLTYMPNLLSVQCNSVVAELALTFAHRISRLRSGETCLNHFTISALSFDK